MSLDAIIDRMDKGESFGIPSRPLKRPGNWFDSILFKYKKAAGFTSCGLLYWLSLRSDRRTGKRIHSMALLTLKVVGLTMIRRRDPRCVAEMTIPAFGRLALIHTLIMTGSTFRHTMSPPQRESSHVVIERGLLPEILGMTILAR